MSTEQILNEADQALTDLAGAVTELRAHTNNVDHALSRYTFTVLVSAAEGVYTPQEFQSHGGLPAVRRAIRILYDKVMADPDLVGYFEGVDLMRLRQQQVKMFLALLGAADYETVDLGYVHDHLRVSAADFEKMMAHLASAVDEVGLPFEDAESLLDRVRVYRDDIVNEDA